MDVDEQIPTLRQALATLEEVKTDANRETLATATETCLLWLLNQTCSHYYCPGDAAEAQADHEGRFQVSIFLLRLVQFKSKDRIARWKANADACLSSCVRCVDGYHKAKVLYLETYHCLTQPDTLAFSRGIQLKEKSGLQELLASGNPSPAQLHQILLNPGHVQSPDLVTLLVKAELPDLVPTLPSPGLIIMACNPESKLRSWARSQLVKCTKMDKKAYSDKFVARKEALDIYAALLSHSLNSSIFRQFTSSDLQTTTDQSVLWQGFYCILQTLDKQVLLAGGAASTGKGKGREGKGDACAPMVRLVCTHLGDESAHFVHVLKAFSLLLDVGGQDVWGEGEAAYAEVVMHSILDNGALEEVIESGGDFSSWIVPFLASISHFSTTFAPAFSAVLICLLDNLQRIRFDNSIKTKAARAALHIINTLLAADQNNLPRSLPWTHLPEARKKALEIHGDFLATLAFSAKHVHPPRLAKGVSETDQQYQLAIQDYKAWLPLSSLARKVVHSICFQDSTWIAANIHQLANDRKHIADGKVSMPELSASMSPGFWSRIYATIKASPASKPVSVAIVFTALVPLVHLQKLLPLKGWTEASFVPLRTGLKQLEALRVAAIDPLPELLQDVADSGTPRFMQQTGIPEALAEALLSPIESIHLAVIAIVSEAYDCEGRADCIKALLTKHPTEFLTALSNSMKHFNKLADTFPEACDNAMRLARCLTNVMDSLCNPVGGLLREAGWVERGTIKTTLPKVWQLMCDSIAAIFSKTPGWAQHYANEAMTAWMRDALIFADSLVSEVRTFEAALTGSSSGSASPVKQSGIGKQLVSSLGMPLHHMLSWLRINDAELTRGTASVMSKTIERFSKANTAIPNKVVTKIRKLAQGISNEKSSNGLLTPQDIFKLVIVVRKHPMHEIEMSDIRMDTEEKAPVPASKPTKPKVSTETAKNWWEKQKEVTTTVKGYKSDKSSPSSSKPEIIDLDAEPAPKSKPPKASSSKLPPPKQPALVVRPLPRGSTASTKPTIPAKQSKIATISKYNFSHATLRAQMARLSEDDDSDSEQRFTGLKGLAAAQKPIAGPTAIKRADGEKRQVKVMDIVGAHGGSSRILQSISNNSRQAAEKAAQVRVNPDFAPLHKVILQWDISSDRESPANLPPPPKVPTSFRDARSYMSCYEPHIMLECWQGIVAAKQQLQKDQTVNLACDVSGRQFIDEFTDIYLAVQGGQLPDGVYYAESDLVIIRQETRSILAKVQAVNRGRQTSLVLRCHFGSDTQGASMHLVPRTVCHVTNLMSLRTTQREYAALSALPYLDLLPSILSSNLPPIPTIDESQLSNTMKAFRVNEPQGRAILQATQQDGFSLIQGPPGTGKTSTIVGIIGALCSKLASRKVGAPKTPARLLLCAPSNAAVDEIVKRLKDGIRGADGVIFEPNIVRIGALRSINVVAQDVFLDELVERRSAPRGSNDSSAKIGALRSEIDKLKQQRSAKQAELESVSGLNSAQSQALEAEIPRLRRAINEKNVALQNARDNQQQSNRAMDAARDKNRRDVLSEADVICSTLSGAGQDYMAALPIDFETVIIDEAAQSVEPSSLIPLKYGCKRCIMVGDPKQLPPTILSRIASHRGYDQSLFMRLYSQNAAAVHLLSIQYRMHPTISAFPSKMFYQSKLQDGPGMVEKTKASWHDNRLFPPYAFMHVKNGREEKTRFNSFVNHGEVTVAMALYAGLKRQLKFGVDSMPTIGVVTGYSGQLSEMKKKFRERFGVEVFSQVDFNTVDGFQGQEKDIIILSCVRGGAEDTGIGFLSNANRMNVALTRARSSLFVLGNKIALGQNQKWGALLSDAEERKCLLDEFFPTSDNLICLISVPIHVDASIFNASNSPVKTTKASPAVTKRKSQVASAPAPEGLMTPKELSTSMSKKGAPANSVKRKAEDQPIKQPEKRTKAEPDLDLDGTAIIPQTNAGVRSNVNGKGVYVRTTTQHPPATVDKKLSAEHSIDDLLGDFTGVSNRTEPPKAQPPATSRPAPSRQAPRPAPSIFAPTKRPAAGGASLFLPQKKRR